MKKIILIIATVAFTVCNANATTEKRTVTTLNETVKINLNDLVIIYDWSVKTNKGYYSGTSPSANNASKMIRLASSGEVILEKRIESYYMLKTDVMNNNKRIYFWEVKSTNGYAKGFSTSESDAQKTMKLVASGDIITSKIIISGINK
tara:strand:- start:864 stop:1307 length:444 start_codon:yes stop_codon:yes gene_type:complete